MAMAWRPCCGICRSEHVVEIYDPSPMRAPRHVQCEACGAPWDGSQLSAAEARLRPAPPSCPAGAPPVKTLLRASQAP